MNFKEMLLLRLASECMEVGHRITKCLDFGLTHRQEGQALTNEERLCDELNDLIAQVEMLHENGILSFIPNNSKIEAKKVKVMNYLELSRELGTLQDGD